jgi:hypothetical protein
MFGRTAQPDQKVHRPRSLGDAKRQVAGIYRANRWDAEERARYQASLGLPGLPVDELEKEHIRAILNDFERARMILYTEEGE